MLHMLIRPMHCLLMVLQTLQSCQKHQNLQAENCDVRNKNSCHACKPWSQLRPQQPVVCMRIHDCSSSGCWCGSLPSFNAVGGGGAIVVHSSSSLGAAQHHPRQQSKQEEEVGWGVSSDRNDAVPFICVSSSDRSRGGGESEEERSQSSRRRRRRRLAHFSRCALHVPVASSFFGARHTTDILVEHSQRVARSATTRLTLHQSSFQQSATTEC